jgi:phenylacetate-CoA ligase
MVSLAGPSVCLGKKFRQVLRFASEAQWWSAEQAREYQLQQLRTICTLAYEKTAYYRRTFDIAGFNPNDLKEPEDLKALPTMNKGTVVENLRDLCTIDPASSNVDYITTGGSGGRPLLFYGPADRSSTEYAYLVSSWMRDGYRLSTSLAVLRGQVVKPDAKGLRHEYDPLLRRHYYSNFHMSDEDVRGYLSHMATIGPFYLLVYPSSATVLALSVQRVGCQVPPNLLGILAGSEDVYPEDRETIERVTGKRVFSWYGHSEKLVMASECEHSHDYHVWPTYGFFELLDGQGLPVTEPGQRGEIVGTGFINTVVPFIRYRTGDYATYVSARCEACGREHTTINNLEGRWPQGNLVTANGSTISLTALNLHDTTFENVRDYQYRQSAPGLATLCIIPVGPMSAEEQLRVLDGASAKLQGQIKLKLEIRTELQKTARGKQMRIVKESEPALPDCHRTERAMKNETDRADIQ